MDDPEIRISDRAILVDGVQVSWALEIYKLEYINEYVNTVVQEEDMTGDAYAADANGEYHHDDDDINSLAETNDIAWK